jgi:hypothetical protein
MLSSKNDASTPRFPRRMCLRAPQGLQEAIQIASRQRHSNPSEYARQALLGALAADGVRLLPDGKVESRAADGGNA